MQEYPSLRPCTNKRRLVHNASSFVQKSEQGRRDFAAETNESAGRLVNAHGPDCTVLRSVPLHVTNVCPTRGKYRKSEGSIDTWCWSRGVHLVCLPRDTLSSLAHAHIRSHALPHTRASPWATLSARHSRQQQRATELPPFLRDGHDMPVEQLPLSRAWIASAPPVDDGDRIESHHIAHTRPIAALKFKFTLTVQLAAPANTCGGTRGYHVAHNTRRYLYRTIGLGIRPHAPDVYFSRDVTDPLAPLTTVVENCQDGAHHRHVTHDVLWRSLDVKGTVGRPSGVCCTRSRDRLHVHVQWERCFPKNKKGNLQSRRRERGWCDRRASALFIMPPWRRERVSS